MSKLTKSDIQDVSADLVNNYDNILLKHGTGTGKTLSFIRMQEMIRPSSVYIIIAERNHQLNWINEYKKHNKEDLLKNVTFFCYNSIHKYINTSVDMICLDEGHHITSDKRLDCLSKINSSKIVILSATIKHNQLEKIESVKGQFFNYYIPLKQAIEYEVVPKPIFYLIPLELNQVNTEIIEFNRGITNKREKIYCEFKDRFKYIYNKKLYPNLHLVIRCTQEQKESYLSDTYLYYKNKYFETRSIVDKNRWLFCGIERKRYLANIKTSHLQLLLTKVVDKRYICFCGSVKQASLLGDKHHLLHSKVKNADKILSDFNEGITNHLLVVDMLKEGTNVEGIEVGIIAQLDGDSGPFIQKSGRIMRSKNPIIYIMYFKKTKDEVYLDNILKEINIEDIRIIEDINNINL